MLIKFLITLGGVWIKRFFLLVAGLSLASILEVLSIGAIYPFLQKLVAESSENPVSFFGYQYTIESGSLIFCILVITSALFRIYISSVQGRVAFGLGEEISDRIYKNVVFSTYTDYENIGIDNFVTSILKKSDLISQQYFLPCLNLFVNTVLCIGILFILMYINLMLTLYIFLFVGSCYFFISIINKDGIVVAGKNISECIRKINQILNISHEGFIENKIYQNEFFFINKFEVINKTLCENLRKIDFLRVYPRYLIESLGVVFLCFMGYIMMLNGERVQDILPILGTVAFCAQRLIPSAQQIYSSWGAIKSTKFICHELFEYLNIKRENYVDKDFSSVAFDNLELCNVSFKYADQLIPVFDCVNFQFNSSERIGIVGESGAGKSTLLKLIIGILQPSQGRVVLNKSLNLHENKKFLWNKISYISQKLTLIPGTIAENIAPGVEKNEEANSKIMSAAQSAKISNYIEGLPDKYETRVGGVNLWPSNGQIQRLILARALYRNPEILILDEFTSALDSETESAIIKEILELFKGRTIVIVSHKTSSLELCEKIYRINSNGIIKITL